MSKSQYKSLINSPTREDALRIMDTKGIIKPVHVGSGKIQPFDENKPLIIDTDELENTSAIKRSPT